MEKLNNARLKPVMIIFGGFLFSFGMNQFIIPQHLFSGGAVGLTQLIEVLIRRLRRRNRHPWGVGCAEV